jgi:hypothetical protein
MIGISGAIEGNNSARMHIAKASSTPGSVSTKSNFYYNQDQLEEGDINNSLITGVFGGI